MTTYSTRIHGPANKAPSTTGVYAQCRLCGGQWQVRDADLGSALRCPWCGASHRAISVVRELGDFGHATVIGGGEIGE